MRVVLLVAAAVLLLVLLGGAGIYALSREPVIAPVSLDALPAFEPQAVARGGELAALGNCDACHEAPGEAADAGGRAVPTPFGSVYASNITPDPDTGIGLWSEAAFQRAMRQGIDREGRQLYPAFPYTHYASLTDADVAALYAFVMTRAPVRNEVPASRLPFPLDRRWIVAGWKLLFFRPTALPSGEGRSPAWRRGAYWVEGLGHCGDCHTPRNFLGAERAGKALAGGESEGWDAPALDADSPAPVPWTADELFTYLRHGAQPLHGAAAGPMAVVTRDLAGARESDVRDIAIFIASQMESQKERRSAESHPPARSGARPRAAPSRQYALADVLFSGACAGCHAAGAQLVPPEGIDLTRSTLLNMPRPRNAARVILCGIKPPAGLAGPWMPSFAGSFTSAQLSGLLEDLRARFSDRPAWRRTGRSIRAVQRELASAP